MDAVAPDTVPRLRACVNQFTLGKFYLLPADRPLTGRLSNAPLRFGSLQHLDRAPAQLLFAADLILRDAGVAARFAIDAVRRLRLCRFAAEA
jgi:hypothetical protein